MIIMLKNFIFDAVKKIKQLHQLVSVLSRWHSKMRHGERICHLNASLTNPIQVRFEKAVRATEVTNMVHYREMVTGMVLENNQRTLTVARELSQ